MCRLTKMRIGAREGGAMVMFVKRRRKKEPVVLEGLLTRAGKTPR